MFAFKTNSTHPVTHVVFDPTGATFAVAQPNYGITLCERSSGQAKAFLRTERVGRFVSALFCAGGLKFAVSSHKGVFLFDVATGNLLGHQGSYTVGGAVLTIRGSELLSVNSSGVREVRESNNPSGGLCAPLSRMTTHAKLIELSPCGRWGFGVHPRVRPSLIHLGVGKVVAAVEHPYRANGSPRPIVCFDSRGERFAVCDGNNIAVYDAPADVEDGDSKADSSLLQRVEGSTIAPRPRRRLVAIFKLERPEGVRPDQSWLPPVAFTPDGRGLLVRRPRNRVQLWDAATNTQMNEWSWRMEWVTCLAVAPDGLTAIAGCRFGRVVMWDLE